MIEILNRQNRYWINRRRFKNLLKKLVKHYRLKNPEVSLVFVNTKTIKKINRKFLRKNAPTDVLSFPIREKSVDGNYYLGDIIISVPQAFKQCLSLDHGLERELELLTIHGFLHLLGYEHSARIEKEEEKIRNLLIRE
jgi:probable rRNA maturation factor